MYEKRLGEILQFLDAYDRLINCHIVDFIVDNLWTTCLPNTLRLELETNEKECIDWREINNHPVLDEFLKLTKSLSLQSCSTEINSTDFTNILPMMANYSNKTDKRVDVQKELMNMKKSHEVERLGNIVGKVAASTKSLVIDAGAGKAYLSTYLAENHDVPVLAIDSSHSCSTGATIRQKKLKKTTNRSSRLVQYIVNEIDENTNYVEMINKNFHEWKLDKNIVLTGLHTCGSLTHYAIKTFLATRDIQFLLIVPCCYHLTNETFNEKIHFSKNARMLAQQSIERSTKKPSVSSSLFYRAVLQVVLRAMGISNARVGRGGPLDNFPSYAKWAFSKIAMEPEKIPSVEELQSIYQLHKDLFERKFHTFQMLRIHTGVVLEAAIMLDRIIFLQKSNLCSKVAILRLFDPILSPRHYGIVAVK